MGDQNPPFYLISMMKKNEGPVHVAIIMDGNGRWAKKKKKSRSQGHREGVKRVVEIIEAARREKVKVLTLFAFSSENWSRPKKEVDMLMRLLAITLRQQMRDFTRSGIQFRVVGRRHGVPQEVLRELDLAQEKTRHDSEMILNLAFNYGSREEIVDAVKKICIDIHRGLIRPEDITHQHIHNALYTQGLPDPDLLIRTSGEKRISNFLLWQLSYSELYFTKKYWPDFTVKEFQKAIKDFQSRERRYGTIKELE